MNLPFFASFILFCIWLTFTLIHVRRNEERMDNAFWEKEALANSTRKKPLDTLSYITIPYDTLPFSLLPDQPEVAECHRLLESLREKKIVNLTGLTNTELKLTYGAPNISLLTEYDQNYTLLVRTLQKWAKLLLDAGYEEEAVTVLEFAVSTHTDVSATYRMLASIYYHKQQMDKIEHLKAVANDLHSVMRPAILRTLEQYCSAHNVQSTDP